ncbi:SAF domain-containing protein [Parageobacillus thermoglucosidasius]|uniref:SAF domain-containing protein n=1 Tax=Parageobacillus thermoglucosidasius TaxID=1426 RepID=UPI000B564F23|nr:SAF domain-containing protein [Parageobacillus thermoglucosidasius]OUM93610.1 MAG: hypothetical protein BAA00_06155 [Parageobacillus thermoglucosidasius]
MKPGVKIALGLLVSLATIAFIFIYDFYIRDRIDSAEVVVVKAGKEILKAETITEDKLAIERRPRESLVEDVVYANEIDQIIGRDAKQDILGNSMISKKMIDFDELVPDESKGEAIRPITSDMIYAKPGSLRRKDIIDIYLVYMDGSTNFQQNGPAKVSSDGQTNEGSNGISGDDEGATNEDKGGNSEDAKTKTEPFLKNVRVVYVKDSSNQEVVSTDEKEDKRLNASSTISDLEVILNEEDFRKLMNEVLGNGAKLYITYQ